MGLKKSILILEGKPSCSTIELIESFGFRNIMFHKVATLDNYIDPEEGFIAVAFWNEFTVIAHNMLPLSMIELDYSNRRYFQEVTIRRYFETKNSLAVILQSTTNSYGMSLLKDGKYSGIFGSDNSNPWEWGERTQIELDYLQNSYINSSGKTIFKIKEEDYTHDQLGENIILWNIENFVKKPTIELHQLEAEVYKINDEHLFYFP